jgi:hypothetical protein
MPSLWDFSVLLPGNGLSSDSFREWLERPDATQSPPAFILLKLSMAGF